jgi:hypothetical protein
LMLILFSGHYTIQAWVTTPIFQRYVFQVEDGGSKYL